MSTSNATTDQVPGQVCCPACGSDDIQGQLSPDRPNTLKTVLVEVFCHVCHTWWDNIYTFDSYKVFHDSNKEQLTMSASNPTSPPELRRASRTGHYYCPVCYSDEIEGHSLDFEPREIIQEMTCLACHADWDAHYAYTGYSALDDSEGEDDL